MTCASPWFFTPAPNTDCPGAQQAAAFTMQSFERGLAFYVPTNNMVYFLAAENSAVNAFTNEWNQSVILPTAVPPSGLIDPQGPIGYVWKNKAWNDGRSLAQVVGWATASSTNYNGILQPGASGEIYLKAATGGVYRLGIGSSTVGTWALVANAP